jgi:hypothetical protein
LLHETYTTTVRLLLQRLQRLAREDSRAALQAQLRVFDPAGKGTVSTEGGRCR